MQKREVVVVGAGPAGLMAAIEAARAGGRVTLVDENSRPGGQLFKQIHKFFGSEEHRAGVRGYEIGYELLDETKRLGVEVMLDTAAWGLFKSEEPKQAGVLGVVSGTQSQTIQAKRIVLATGAVEQSLAFPGWTLPGVMGAGAAQTLMNVHRVLPGQRVLMVGAGNVGLIVAYQLLQAGAEVVAVVEARPKVGGYHVHAAKLRRAGVPILVSHTVARAGGRNCVQRATVMALDAAGKPRRGTERDLKVDLICLSVGLRPMAELCWLIGCKFRYLPVLGGHVPVHDADMQSSVHGLYVAGDLAGVEEASTAMEEGRLAGIAVAESLGQLRPKTASDLKSQARQRLAALRMGAFGDLRAQAKRELMTGR